MVINLLSTPREQIIISHKRVLVIKKEFLNELYALAHGLQ